jgi:hypothetical protein
VERELTGSDSLFLAGVIDELSGQTGGVAIRDHPAGDIATKDVQDHIQVVEADPLAMTVWFPAFAIFVAAPPPPHLSEQQAVQTGGPDAKTCVQNCVQ